MDGSVFTSPTLGDINLQECQRLTFPDGILPWGAAAKWFRVPNEGEEGNPFHWLHCEDPNNLMLTVVPADIFKDEWWAHPDVPEHIMDKIEASNFDEIEVLWVVTLTNNILECTINTLAPIFIGPNNVAVQHVFMDAERNARELLFK